MNDNTIKVLHVVLSMETGGLENGIVNLVNHSNKTDFTVDVLCLRAKGELADRISNSNSKVIYYDNNISLLSSVKKIIQATKEDNYQIVHSHGFTTMLACYIANFFSRMFIHINGEHGTLYYSSLKKRLIQKYLFSKMALNLSVSTELKNTIIEKFNLVKDNFKPIINGVNTAKFRPPEGLGQRNILAPFNFNNGDIIIGSVGRLVAIKNYPSLIDAFAIVSENKKNCHLVLAGDGPERKGLEKKIKSLNLTDRIHLLGRRDDVPTLIKEYDIFVLPSFSEGLSNTILEAMSCGVPVVASNVGGNHEIVIENITGYLYPSNNITELSRILENLIDNPSKIKSLSSNARQHILDNHSIDSMVENYENTYRELLNNNLTVTNYTSLSN